MPAGLPFAPAFSPDGRTPAVVTDDADGEGNFSLYVVNADGIGLRAVTRDESGAVWNLEPAFRPDGAALVSGRCQVRPTEDGESLPVTSDIYVMRANGSGERRPTRNAGLRRFGAAPAFSPDGRRIAYVIGEPFGDFTRWPSSTSTARAVILRGPGITGVTDWR